MLRNSAKPTVLHYYIPIFKLNKGLLSDFFRQDIPYVAFTLSLKVVGYCLNEILNANYSNLSA